MDLRDLQRNVSYFGLSGTLFDLGLRAANRFLPLRVLRGLKIERVNPDFLCLEPPFRALRLSPEQMRRYVSEECELTPQFLHEAAAKHDECFAVLDDDQLASYGWYSTSPTRIDLPGLVLNFDKHYVYMYKGFTHVKYRGKRLHAVGMTLALQDYLQRGYRGLVSYVEATNAASLKSVYRMGYEDFGTIALARLGRRYIVHCDRGCRALNFTLEPARGVE